MADGDAELDDNVEWTEQRCLHLRVDAGLVAGRGREGLPAIAASVAKQTRRTTTPPQQKVAKNDKTNQGAYLIRVDGRVCW